MTIRVPKYILEKDFNAIISTHAYDWHVLIVDNDNYRWILPGSSINAYEIQPISAHKTRYPTFYKWLIEITTKPIYRLL